jgi:hypothetical protein
MKCVLFITSDLVGEGKKAMDDRGKDQGKDKRGK